MTVRTPTVALERLAGYDDPDGVAAAVRNALGPLGGMERFVKPGMRVVIKPNLLFGRAPERALNTHPEIVRAVGKLVREAGAGEIMIGDSPGFGSARGAAKICGILPVAEELGAKFVEFTPVENIDPKRAFPRLELARELLAADLVVNLPKMKTHGQMLMTLAVKNMFGAVPGTRKFQWHYRAGRDKIVFARMLNDIALAVRPGLSILDAVLSMDGMGPSAGRPRRTGFIAAADDPWALDAAVMDVLGLERTLLFTLREADERGLRGWRDAAVVGERPEDLRPGEWDVPELVGAQMHGTFIEKRLPGVAKWLRARISPPPGPNSRCIRCGYCVDICPAGAMRMEAGVVVDADACIRCYCCHELCRYDGMDLPRPGLLSRILGFGG
ncbi:MAG: DUF362 domain-containing protein [Planctomycetota bacterium]|jgi:uncharacterized protein (DUF362 family)/Pyruvate/2-oxoacid:ferredoxin oxidoreductase delta subunit|nr:DUF362 domain-containing protein [Planctomycetota bacterium]